MTDELPPGCELDALIAEKVMGWTECDAAATWTKWQHGDPGDIWIEIEEPWCRGHGKPPGVSKFRPYPRYSEDIAAAWEVVAKIGETHVWCIVGPEENANGDIYSAEIGYDSGDFEYHVRWAPYHACAKTLPHAICLAAIQVVRATLTL